MVSPFPVALKPAARSAYRSVLRSARITFQGDQPRRIALTDAVRKTFSSPTLTIAKPDAPPSSSASASSSATASTSSNFSSSASGTESDFTEEELSKRIQEWKDVAIFLRRNVVQGEQDSSGAFKLRVTSDTELGDNHSIKNPPVLPTTPFPNRNKRKTASNTASA